MDHRDSKPKTTSRPRVIAALVLLACLGLLLFAAHLDTPAEAAQAVSQGGRATSLGSYGYPGCGFKSLTGLPCASCGMTRSFAYMVEGDLLAAFKLQPAGAVLCVGVAMMALIAGWSVLTAMPMGPVFQTIFRPKPVIGAVAFILIVWVLNILRYLGA